MRKRQIGQFRHRVQIVQTTKTRTARGDFAEVETVIATRSARIVRRGVSGEQEFGQGPTSFDQYFLEFRYDPDVMGKLTGSFHFVMLTQQSRTYEAVGPAMDFESDYRVVRIPVAATLNEASL